MSDVDDALDMGGLEDRELLERVKGVLRQYSASRPRTLQKELGPSEIGSFCQRQLAFKLTAVGKVNADANPMPSLRGIAMHALMEEALRLDNEISGETNWIPESQVFPREGLFGTCDCFEVQTSTVLDWKFPGPSRLKKYRDEGPSWQYRVQAHTYGRGYKRMGFDVKKVGICFMDVNDINRSFIWREPYNEAIPQLALDNIDRVKAMVEKYNVVQNPDNYKLIPITPTEDCRICDYWTPNPWSPRQCNGKC